MFNATFSNNRVIAWWSVLLWRKHRLPRRKPQICQKSPMNVRKRATNNGRTLSHSYLYRVHPAKDWNKIHNLRTSDRNRMQWKMKIQMPYNRDEDGPSLYNRLVSNRLSLWGRTLSLYNRLVSNRLSLDVKWAPFQLYHDENKLHFDQMMSALICTRSIRLVGFLWC